MAPSSTSFDSHDRIITTYLKVDRFAFSYLFLLSSPLFSNHFLSWHTISFDSLCRLSSQSFLFLEAKKKPLSSFRLTSRPIGVVYRKPPIRRHALAWGYDADRTRYRIGCLPPVEPFFFSVSFFLFLFFFFSCFYRFIVELISYARLWWTFDIPECLTFTYNPTSSLTISCLASCRSSLPGRLLRDSNFYDVQ